MSGGGQASSGRSAKAVCQGVCIRLHLVSPIPVVNNLHYMCGNYFLYILKYGKAFPPKRGSCFIPLSLAVEAFRQGNCLRSVCLEVNVPYPGAFGLHGAAVKLVAWFAALTLGDRKCRASCWPDDGRDATGLKPKSLLTVIFARYCFCGGWAGLLVFAIAADC